MRNSKCKGLEADRACKVLGVPKHTHTHTHTQARMERGQVVKRHNWEVTGLARCPEWILHVLGSH